MLNPANGEIILLYSTSRQDNNENREAEERHIYWDGQRMEAESKRKWDYFLMFYYVRQNNDLRAPFIQCHEEKMQKQPADVPAKPNDTVKLICFNDILLSWIIIFFLKLYHFK